MNICSCGNVSEEDGAKCARCKALQALELKAGAMSEEIHHSFEVLSKAWHPDRFQDDGKMKAMAEEKLKAIEAAFSLLTRGSVQAERFHSREARASQVAVADSAPQPDTATQGAAAQKLGFSDRETRPIRIPVPLLIGCGVLLAAIAMGWLFFRPLDALLMGMPVAGKVYAEFKADIRTNIQELENKIGIGAGSGAPTPAPSEPASGPAQSEQKLEAQKGSATAKATALHQGASGRVAPRTGEGRPMENRALPLITAGLTKSEVLSAQGAPTGESTDELDYGDSKLYFSNGTLYGWRIEPSSPLRVKLWPDGSVDPDLVSFGMGSTKNEVIVVQGTPTTFSPTIFGYGKSEVYFQYGKVVGWKSDPATPLRTTSP
jgi:curved DNA-binding protein CbpA